MIDMPHAKWLSIEGLVNFSARFIPGFSKTRTKAVELRKQWKDGEIEIKESMRANPKKREELLNQLAQLKQTLQLMLREIVDSWIECIKENTLTCPKPKSKLGLATDASGIAISYVLFELETRRIIEFGGRKLPEPALRYEIQEKEGAAIAEALAMTRLHTYLAESIVVYVDNKNVLANIKNESKEIMSDRMMRFVNIIQSVPNARFEYVESKKNTVADYISRNPHILDVKRNVFEGLHAKYPKTLEPEIETGKRKAGPINGTAQVTPYMACSGACIPLDGGENDCQCSPATVFGDKTVETIGITVEGQQRKCLRIRPIQSPSSPNHNEIQLNILEKNVTLAVPDEKTQVHTRMTEQQVRRIHNQFGHPGIERLMKLCRLFGHQKGAKKEVVTRVVNTCRECIEKKKILPAACVGRKEFGSRPRQIIAIDHFSPFDNTDEKGYTSILSLKGQCENRETRNI